MNISYYISTVFFVSKNPNGVRIRIKFFLKTFSRKRYIKNESVCLSVHCIFVSQIYDIRMPDITIPNYP